MVPGNQVLKLKASKAGGQNVALGSLIEGWQALAWWKQG